jgi:FXSXX-COOH protein
MRDESDDFGDVLIDVTELSLRDLDTIGESSLGAALRYVLDGEAETRPVAAFSSRI